ncbi:MAG: 16S rRNA (cytidine(1402)-2'-O)-methyltransferase [Kiritimatiellia bacterium]
MPIDEELPKPLEPQLYVIATPLGNLGDLTPRAREVLSRISVIACEDTRRTWQLLSALGIPRPEMFSYRQGNEAGVSNRIAGFVRTGTPVALCSDGGYPGISDPGYRVIRTFAVEGLPYTVLPGPCSVDLALLLSGLPTSSYTFKGFPPRKSGQLRKFFEQEKTLPHTLICLESPFRVSASLKVALEVLGNREGAVCLEMTKLHERVLRGTLLSLIEQLGSQPPKGEVTYVIAGANPKFDHTHPTEEPDDHD